MPYGMGDLLAGAMGGNQLNQDIASAITPNPNPLAQQGGGGDGASQQTQQGLARPAVTQQDPTVGNLAMMLTRRSEMARAAEGFNRGTAEMASAFGTAQQQASKRAALGASGGGANPLGDVQDIMGIQDAVTKQNEHARFMAHMDVLARTLFPGDPDGLAKATEVANNSGLLSQFGQTAASNAAATQTSKDFNVAQAATAAQIKAEHPDWTQEQIQKETNMRVPPSLLMSGVGGTPADQEYAQYAAGERAAGRTPLGPVEWNEKQKISAIGQETQTKQSTEFKDTAIQDFDTAHQKLTLTESQIDQLLANMPATMKALQYPSLLTTSGAAATASAFGVGVPDDVKKQAVAAQQLIAGLTGESLSTIKNLRNQREFNTLGIAATAGLNANNGEDGVRKALEGMKAKAASAHANVYATAGKTIPSQYSGLADERYTSKTIDGRDNPYYTGATYEPKDSGDTSGGGGGKPLPAATDTWIQQKLSSSPGEKAAVIKHFEDMGFDMSKYK